MKSHIRLHVRNILRLVLILFQHKVILLSLSCLVLVQSCSHILTLSFLDIGLWESYGAHSLSTSWFRLRWRSLVLRLLVGGDRDLLSYVIVTCIYSLLIDEILDTYLAICRQDVVDDLCSRLPHKFMSI